MSGIQKKINKKQNHKEINTSLKELNKSMTPSASLGEGMQYYQLESGYNDDLEHLKTCMQKMIGIISSLNHCSEVSEQKYNSVMRELNDLNIRIARLEGHDFIR